MPKLAAVTFDLWQTLILDSPEVGRPRGQKRLTDTLELLRAEGYAFTLEHLQTAFRACLTVCDQVRDRGDDLAFDEQVDLFLDKLDPALLAKLPLAARRELGRRYADCYLDHPPAVDPHAQFVLRSAQAMGFKLALICNTGATPGFTQRAFLERAGLAQYFTLLVFSDEERASKPAPRIFSATLSRLGATPSETVHVGDHLRNDVFGAQQVGLRTIWLRRAPAEPEVKPDAQVDTLDQVLEALERLAS